MGKTVKILRQPWFAIFLRIVIHHHPQPELVGFTPPEPVFNTFHRPYDYGSSYVLI
jgi:hypothetical protein